MADPPENTGPENLISRFKVERLLNQDQGGRRISLYGTISEQPSILLLEKNAFPTSLSEQKALPSILSHIKVLGQNDIYLWCLASSTSASSSSGSSATPFSDVKISLISPCTEDHIKKYSQQGARMVTETPALYKERVRPYMQKRRDQGKLDWVWNILEGRAEQENVIMNVTDQEDGFVLVPDLNWDRKTISSLHLLAIARRRDIWSLRDLKKSHIPWLKHMREKLLDATVKLYPQLEPDQLKLYIHYQPTYYHFHIHIVNVALDAGLTQATGKAFGLENIISQLETMAGDQGAGMADVDLTYALGEASELWTEIFLRENSRHKLKEFGSQHMFIG